MLPARIPPPPAPPVTLPKLLLVEGDTPMHFFEALLGYLGLESAIEIRNFRGVGDFKTYVADLAVSDEFKAVTSIGVVRDAEQDAAAALQSVRDALVAAKLQAAVNTSVFILPDNSSPGMLETLCIGAVPACD